MTTPTVQQTIKRRIWKDKLTSTDSATLLQILDQASTTFKPYYTKSTEAIAQKLWLFTDTEYVDSVLSSSKSSDKPVMGESWFSIEKKYPQNENSLMTSFQSSQFSFPDSMVSEGSESLLKTMKIRLLPTAQEKVKLLTDENNFRWLYNFSLDTMRLECARTNKKIEEYRSISNITLRDKIVSKYNYTEEIICEDESTRLVQVDYIYDEGKKGITIPEWMGEVHTRLPRGAIKKLSGNINSALTNKRNGNISHFQLKHLREKENGFVLYEDAGFPSWIKDIESRYWFTGKDRKRRLISFRDIFNSTTKKGLEIVHDKLKDQFYLHYPVDVSYFPPTDRRSDNQREFERSEDDRVIALDPGVRKFMVGYDPKGSLIYVGQGANLKLSELLHKIDKLKDRQKQAILWRKIKNLVSELHFKTISYLLKNYDTILLPDFRISQMVKGKKLAKIVKRLLCMFSFHSFKEKLIFSGKRHGKKVIIVDESFTSQTCGQCGERNKMGGLEFYRCSSCFFEVDRDVNGSRNILMKNLSLR